MRNTGFQGPLWVQKIGNFESSQNHPKSIGIGQESNFNHFGIIKTPLTQITTLKKQEKNQKSPNSFGPY